MAEPGQPMDEAQFRTWKAQLVPLLYDWFSNHNLTWPSQACRWGPQLDDHVFKTRTRIYISEQTASEDAANDPPKLLLVDADICKQRVAASEVVATWTELSKCPYVREVKAITHPGEVNKIRELPQHPEVIVTHTDAPELYVWNTASQPHCVRDKETRRWPAATPDATLVGHERDALFPLATCNAAALVASGGTDKLLVLWDLRDLLSGLARKGEARGEGGRTTTRLEGRQKLRGHRKTVEDLVFQPGSDSCLVSVGDDAQVLFWDTSSGNAPVASIAAAHGSCDVHTVDWSGLQDHLIATGAADGSLKVWDRRKLPASGSVAGGALHAFTFHSDAIMRVEWHPTEQGVLASGGEDHLVAVWSLDRRHAPAAQAGAAAPPAPAQAGGRGSRSGGSKDVPPEVLFKHVGHRAGKVVDFQWCPHDPWTMMSVSDDTLAGDESSSKGGGTLQIWRISDLLYRPEDEVVAELDKHREWIETGREPPQAADAAAAGEGAAAAAAADGDPPKHESGGGVEAAADAAAGAAADAAAPMDVN